MFSKSQVADALAPVIEAERNGEDGFPIFQALAEQHTILGEAEVLDLFARARERYRFGNEDSALDLIVTALNGTASDGFAVVVEDEADHYPSEDEEEADSNRIAHEEDVRVAVRAILYAAPDDRMETAFAYLNQRHLAPSDQEVTDALVGLERALFDGGLEAAVKVALEFLARAEDQAKAPVETTLSVEERLARLENIARGQGLL
jgi:hypothetical protein